MRSLPLVSGIEPDVEVLPELSNAVLPPGVDLAEKDKPILAAALASGASHLITGDRQNFGGYLGKRIEEILIVTPRQYLASPEQR